METIRNAIQLFTWPLREIIAWNRQALFGPVHWRWTNAENFSGRLAAFDWPALLLVARFAERSMNLTQIQSAPIYAIVMFVAFLRLDAYMDYLKEQGKNTYLPLAPLWHKKNSSSNE